MKEDSYEKLGKGYRKALFESVRTTFKLSEDTHNIINWIIEEKNLKPKEVFDLIFDIKELVDFAVQLGQKNEKNNTTTSIRKTFVISKQALSSINKLSKDHKLSRDLIVENLLLFFKKFLEKFEERERKLEEKAYEIVNNLCEKSGDVEEQLIELLGRNNPIINRLGYAIVILSNLVGSIDNKIKNNVPIDPDDMTQ